MKFLEVIDYYDDAGIGQLVDECYNVEEPGFQVKLVRNMSELEVVFDSIRRATPERATRSQGYGRLDSPGVVKAPGLPHTDKGFHDLAIRLNALATYPVTLGSSAVGHLSGFSRESFPWENVENTRVGIDYPGSLTIFSQGGYEWLPETVHFYEHDRQTIYWARFMQDGYFTDLDIATVDDMFQIINRGSKGLKSY
jgi:hypothetical protein